MWKFTNLLILTAALLLGCVTSPSASPDPASIEVAGTLGLADAEANGCLAVWVPMTEDLALDGVIWYNNDATVAFPSLAVQSGSPDYPVSLADAFTVVEGVDGVSLGWSEVTFDQPVITPGDGIYVIFRLPTGGAATAAGDGGGPALGYAAAADGLPGWLSGNGEDWMQIHPDYGFAVIPQFIARTPGMLAKAALGRPANRRASEDLVQDARLPAATLLCRPAPNPFNPQTELKFALARDGQVALDIYSLRGERLRALVSESLSAGEHAVTWDGRSDDGRGLPSGVYVARLTAGPVVSVQRLTLIR